MKTNIYKSKSTLLLTALMTIFLVACEDPDLRFQDFEESQTGAYARRLAVDGSFSKADPSASVINISVEFYDKNQGKDVSSYDWAVKFLPGGDASAATTEAALFSLSSNQFSENASGLPSISFSLTMADALSALGMDIDAVEAGDSFRFEATLRTASGDSFSSTNTGPNMISQSPFGALFRLDAQVN